MTTTTDRAGRFTRAYDATYADLLRFVRRRLPDGGEDVVAETMTTVWRRVDDLPHELDDARAWIYGIAHRTMLNHHRGHRRAAALGVRLAAVGAVPATVGDVADAAVPRADLARAWAALPPDAQEVLALTVLDGLSSEHAGRVLGISAAAYRHRLSRARGDLRRLLDGPTGSTLSLAGARMSRPPATTQEVSR